MFAQLQSRFARWRLYRHTLRELNYLDTHLLHDIGLEQTTARALKNRAKTSAEEACL